MAQNYQLVKCYAGNGQNWGSDGDWVGLAVGGDEIRRICPTLGQEQHRKGIGPPERLDAQRARHQPRPRRKNWDSGSLLAAPHCCLLFLTLGHVCLHFVVLQFAMDDGGHQL